MATVYREGNLDLLDGKVAVLGHGSQGHAHALNLRDSGVEVEVGLRAGSPSWEAAEAAGLAVATVAEAVSGAQVVSFLLPDGAHPRVYEEGDVLPNLDPSAALLFAHGFNVHYGRVAPPPGHDVIMVAPKGRATSSGASSRRGSGRRRSSRSRRTRAGHRSSSLSPTAPRSAPRGPG